MAMPSCNYADYPAVGGGTHTFPVNQCVPNGDDDKWYKALCVSKTTSSAYTGKFYDTETKCENDESGTAVTPSDITGTTCNNVDCVLGTDFFFQTTASGCGTALPDLKTQWSNGYCDGDEKWSCSGTGAEVEEYDAAGCAGTANDTTLLPKAGCKDGYNVQIVGCSGAGRWTGLLVTGLALAFAIAAM